MKNNLTATIVESDSSVTLEVGKLVHEKLTGAGEPYVANERGEYEGYGYSVVVWKKTLTPIQRKQMQAAKTLGLTPEQLQALLNK